MAKKMKIEEQVAQLTQEQQDKIVRVGKVSRSLELGVGIPYIISLILGFLILVNLPLSFDSVFFHGFQIWCGNGVVFFLGLLIFIKVKYPYYSDAKWRYIVKSRKRKQGKD